MVSPWSPPIPLQIANPWAIPRTVSKRIASRGHRGLPLDRIGVRVRAGRPTDAATVLPTSVPVSSSAKGIGSRSTMGLPASRLSHLFPVGNLCRSLRQVRPAGFEPATKGFKGPRVSTRLGLSHPPQVGSWPGSKSLSTPTELEHECGGRALVGRDYCWGSPR